MDKESYGKFLLKGIDCKFSGVTEPSYKLGIYIMIICSSLAEV